MRGWYESLDPERTRAASTPSSRAAGSASAVPWWGLIRLAFSSPARVAMVQAQDVLGLGSEARMNRPGRPAATGAGSCERGALTPALARRLREATEAAGRLPS